MNRDDLIGLTVDQAQSFWRETSSQELRVVESAPPQRPAQRPHSNRSARKTKTVAQAKPVRVQHWGERRVLRCREASENGMSFLEVTIAREEAVSASVAHALQSAEHESSC